MTKDDIKLFEEFKNHALHRAKKNCLVEAKEKGIILWSNITFDEFKNLLKEKGYTYNYWKQTCIRIYKARGYAL